MYAVMNLRARKMWSVSRPAETILLASEDGLCLVGLVSYDVT